MNTILAENYRGFEWFEVGGVGGNECELLGSDTGELENCLYSWHQTGASNKLAVGGEVVSINLIHTPLRTAYLHNGGVEALSYLFKCIFNWYAD